MISFADNNDAARLISNAALNDATNKGNVYEYWLGETNTNPQGTRKEVFDTARRLYDIGRVALVQDLIDDGVYSYRMIVK